MKHFRSSIFLVLIIAVLPTNAPAATIDQNIFPKGPYDSQLLTLNVLGSEAADFSAILLPNGTIRGYAPNLVALAFSIFESKDSGKSFTNVGKIDFGSENSDNFLGQPRVTKLNDGRYHLYSNNSQGISCFSSTDGIKFVIDKLNCIPNEIIPTPPHFKGWRLSGLSSVIALKDGRYRAYFSDSGIENDDKYPPHHIYSVISKDGVNWSREPGLRIGPSAKGVTTVAIHPEAIQHSDGSVTVFFRSWPDQNQMYATSKDGLNFSDVRILWWKSKNPIAGYGNEGGDPSVIKDKTGKLVLFQGTRIENNGLGVSSIRLTPGKGTKFGEEVGRDLNVNKRVQADYINCVATDTPSDPAFAKVSIMTTPNDMQCPDGYTLDSTNPKTMFYGPAYSKTTQCLWIGSGEPPLAMYERYFSGTVGCPQNYKIGSGKPVTYPQNRVQSGGSAPGNPPGEMKPTSPVTAGLVCYAKTGMVVRFPRLDISDSNASCPDGYSTTPNSAKQTTITCVAQPGTKVNDPEMALVGVGITPQCPQGYKKK